VADRVRRDPSNHLAAECLMAALSQLSVPRFYNSNNNQHMKITAILTAMVVLACCFPAAAATYTVGETGGYQFTTIQAAINWAADGDVVQVYPAPIGKI